MSVPLSDYYDTFKLQTSNKAVTTESEKSRQDDFNMLFEMLLELIINSSPPVPSCWLAIEATSFNIGLVIKSLKKSKLFSIKGFMF